MRPTRIEPVESHFWEPVLSRLRQFSLPRALFLSGWIADRVILDGRPLLSFKMEAAGTAAFLIVVILGTLVMFTPKLATAMRKGTAEYGLLASQFVFCFQEKWMQKSEHEAKELLCNDDIRSLSELTTSSRTCARCAHFHFGQMTSYG